MNTKINFAGIEMKNPVTVASGTFGYGREFSEFFDLSKLGAIITKGTSLKPRSGNKPSRVYETASGMLNSIGLQNPGVEYFAKFDLPFLKKFDTKIIVNACGSSIDEYVELCKILNTLDIDGVELNLSCPNVKAGCLAFGTTYEGVKEVTTQVSEATVDCGIIYQTDAASAGLTVVDTATAEMCGQVIYPAAVLNKSEHQDEAKSFLEFLTGSKADAIFEAVGFTPIA